MENKEYLKRNGIICHAEQYEKNGITHYIYMVHRRKWDKETKKASYDHIEIYSKIKHTEQEMISYQWKTYNNYGRYEEIEN